MGQYKNRQSLTEAIQFNGVGESWAEITNFLSGPSSENLRWNAKPDTGGSIFTVEGAHPFYKGDWITKDVNGHFDVCREEAFDEIYEYFNTDFPVIGPECFSDKEGTVISYKGEHYYKACNAFVKDNPDGGQSFCVKRVNHPGRLRIHESYDGTIRKEACKTCTVPPRETVGMVCQTCGTDYSK